MTPSVWSYDNDTFRGYVKTYSRNVVTNVPCKIVRKNRLKAMEDAKKLIPRLRKSIRSTAV
jgi:hypothetical protein